MLEKMVENLATSVERIGGKLAIAQQEDETDELPAMMCVCLRLGG